MAELAEIQETCSSLIQSVNPENISLIARSFSKIPEASYVFSE